MVRFGLVTRCVVMALGAGLLGPGCGREQPVARPGGDAHRPQPAEEKAFAAYLDAQTRGLGAMERFEYPEAVAAFRQALANRPGSNPARTNLAIALLNDTGNKTEAGKSGHSADGPAPTNFEESLALLGQVLDEEPDNLTAHFSRGMIFEYLGEIDRAHRDFEAVTRADPDDSSAWVKLGMTLPHPDQPGKRASLESAQRLVEIYGRAFELNPNSVLAAFKLQEAYNWLALTNKDPNAASRRAELNSLWLKLNRARSATGPGDFDIDAAYGSNGKYSLVVDPFGTTLSRRATDLERPRFDVGRSILVALPGSDRWTGPNLLASPNPALRRIGAFRARFGAGICHFDANGDGRLDLLLPSGVETAAGVRDILLINRADGVFEDGSQAFGLPSEGGSLAAAASDFDADRQIDLLLVGPEGVRLLRNVDGARFDDQTELLGELPAGALYAAARWCDLDQDGDLDLILLGTRDEAASGAPANRVYRNDGTPAPVENEVPQNQAPIAVAPEGLQAVSGLRPKFTVWEGPELEALIDAGNAHSGIALADFDSDRDTDIVLVREEGPPVLVLNDRLGRFRALELPDLKPDGRVNGVLVLDLDRDGRPDLVQVLGQSRLTAWRNVAPRHSDPGEPPVRFAHWPTDAARWRSGLVTDLDLDGWPDLLGLPEPSNDQPPVPTWARNQGSRLGVDSLALSPPGTDPLVGLDLVDLAGDPLPELLLIFDGSAPRWLANLGNGNHWLALTLAGRWKFGFDFMRTNAQGWGSSVRVQGPDLAAYGLVTPESSAPGQSVGPLVLGLGAAPSAALLRVLWPDGVMQAELNVPGDQSMRLTEQNRKTGSCPVLFTYDGSKYVCIGDFLGGGGLGYLVAPGVYGEPDRDESVLIAGGQLASVEGAYRISITEPMDELAYLDSLALDVVDCPPGVEAVPDERFAPAGDRPTGQLITYRKTIAPVAATDLAGASVLPELSAFDRVTVDRFDRLRGWIGYAREHGIVLDFGDQLANLEPGSRMFLCLAGWVEYPYSQTNYAASTAGVALAPPVLEQQNADGSWSLVHANPGYPAGLPRIATLELTDALERGRVQGRCVLRVRTNMECYYDQAFIAVAGPEPAVRVTRLPVARGRLGYRGYTREVSPDGRLPLLYDYAFVDPAPLARFAGRATRYGDVVELLNADDDQQCLIAPGDELLASFDAAAVPELPTGWTRRFVLRTTGYCKDADPFTAGSDQVGPLPWKGMPATYPFGPADERPLDAEYQRYLDTYQTRTLSAD